MPQKKLTDLFVERVKPAERGRVEYFDAVFGGLALRVTDSGHKSWSVHYRLGGRLRRYTIGAYPAIKPAQARREASAVLERVRQGFDPTAEKRSRRLTEQTEDDTFGALARDYLDRQRRNAAPSTAKEADRSRPATSFRPGASGRAPALPGATSTASSTRSRREAPKSRPTGRSLTFGHSSTGLSRVGGWSPRPWPECGSRARNNRGTAR